MKKIYGFTGLTGFAIILGAAGAAERNTIVLTLALMIIGALLMSLAELGSRYGKRIGIGFRRKRMKRGVRLSEATVSRTPAKYKSYAQPKVNAGNIPAPGKRSAVTVKA